MYVTDGVSKLYVITVRLNGRPEVSTCRVLYKLS